jgi:prepilin-type N-terminal cleavage/methylation domain-containing protein
LTPAPPAARGGGFSLVEVLCALVILGVGLVGVSRAMTLALHASKEAERETQVIQLAAGRMDTLRADGFFTEGEEEGEFTGDFPQFRWRQTISRTSLDGLYQVVVAVEESASGERLYELETLLFQAPFEPLGEESDGRSTSLTGKSTLPRAGRRGRGL